jgi:hypothetical protein
MNRTALSVTLAGLALVVFTSCRTGGIYNVVDSPITTACGKQPSLDQVTKAIVEAGAGLGWSMAVVKPGLIAGTLNLRGHQAVVEIPYTTQSYSINYKSSKNLKYDAEKQTIHRNYASWVKNLDDAIRARLAPIGC